MLIACWSVKGGVGTTVLAAGLALAADCPPEDPCILADLAGDLPAALGLAEPSGPGLAEWSRAGSQVPPDALARLVTEVKPGVRLLHRGRGAFDPSRARVLIQLLAGLGREVVVDCGLVPGEVSDVVAAEADRSWLVTRPCLLGLRRASAAPVRPSGVVVVSEAGRALDGEDVSTVVGAPLVADLAVDPAVARAVDAGLLTSRLPRRFAEALRDIR